ncbi:MAG: iron complex outermembrane recepter protein [Bacteroidetes bacterium]|nr:MAG: iron complex outermembrane recepter protein [Bacteroidota bacterium]
MKKIWVIAIVMAFSHLSLLAQEVSIVDALTRSPLPFVTITSKKVSFITNEFGKADVTSLKGNDSIYFGILGYETKVVSFRQLEYKNFVVLMKPADFKLDEVVVSATRWAQSRSEVSQRVSSIRATEIAMQNPQTAADLIGQSGEVFIQKSQQGGGSPMIRGFATNRLLIAVDGVRMNNAIFRSGNIQNILSVDPYSVESAEVLFGPGSVIYGSDAIGGVMLFNTLKPVFSENGTKVSGKAATRFSSANNELSSHLDVTIAGEKWASVTSFSFNRYGDLRMGTVGPDEYLKKFTVVRMDSIDRVVESTDPLVQSPSGFSQQNLMQKVFYKPSDAFQMEYGLYYSTTSDYARYDRLLRLRNGLPRSAEWYYGPQKWLMNKLTLVHQKPMKLYDQMQFTAALQHFAESRHDRDLNKVIKYNRFEEVTAFSVNLDFNKQFGIKDRLLYGAEIVLNDVVSKGTDENIQTGIIIPGPARYPASTWSSYAIFATYQYHLRPKTMAQIGLRYNLFALDAEFDTTLFPLPFKYASFNKGALTGSLGLVHKASESFSVSANFATGFRSPNVDDLGKIFDSEPGAVLVPNPDLKPEYAYNADLGLSKVIGGLLKIDLTGYYTILTDALVRREFQLNGADSIIYNGEMSRVLAIQNAARASVYGLQGALELKLPKGFSFLTNLTWQKGVEELDDGSTSPLRHAAPLFGMSRLRYATGKGMLELNAHYSSEVSFENMPEEEKSKDYMYALDENGNPFSPAWYTLNLKAMVKVNEHLNVGGGVENILDKRYRPYSSGLVASGRNLLFSLQFVF